MTYQGPAGEVERNLPSLPTSDPEFQIQFHSGDHEPDLFAPQVPDIASCQLRAFWAKPFNEVVKAPGFTRVVVELRTPDGARILATCKAHAIFWDDVKSAAIQCAHEEGRSPETVSLLEAAVGTDWELESFCSVFLSPDAIFAWLPQEHNEVALPELQGPFAYMDRVVVGAYNRRRGIGSLLVRTMLKVLKNKGVRCVVSMPSSLLKYELESHGLQDLDAAERGTRQRHQWALQKSEKFHTHIEFREFRDSSYFYYAFGPSDPPEGQNETL